MIESFAQRLKRGDLLVGTIVTLNSPSIAELLSAAGYDWLFIDAEHAPLSMSEAQSLIQAARVPCLIRVPEDSEATIKKALDTGAAGIIVPQVNSPEQAERIVQRAKYPPLGCRGVGVARAQGYGFSMREYLYEANDETAVVVQIEHKDALEFLDPIASVPGVDALFVGPYDLSASMELAGQVTHPGVVAAIERITEAGTDNHRRLGIYVDGPGAAKEYIGKGYTLMAVGMDARMLGVAARGTILALR